MFSQELLLTTMDHLVQQINHMTVLKNHWELAKTRLTNLRYALNGRTVMNDTIQINYEIGQTVFAIDEIVASCVGENGSLDGVTYRELESVLVRLHLRLAQHQADIVDDYETKVQILTNAYHEQQILLQKVFDDKIKQRLQSIEQNTQRHTIEQLQLLRQKHFNIIEVYLQSCIELHRTVPLTGLSGDIVAKVAHTFYHIPFEDQIRLQQQWQSSDLPLTRTFIQFKQDKSTAFERHKSRRLLLTDPKVNRQHHTHANRKEMSKGIWEQLVSAPYMMSMLERDRYEQQQLQTDDLNEENIIRTKRWIVILGDPGSGKTSFARYLVSHLAQTLLLNGQHATDYGPLRIPILIRIGEFAQLLKQQPSLTLFDYIGKHQWMGKTLLNHPSISLDQLSSALQDYIKHGQALIILNGLDEIPLSDQRSLIINLVENFVDTYVQTPTGTSVFDDLHLTKLLDDPSRSGGNQLIVTSRIVGYHAAPLAGQFAHYTIRPMDLEHMKDFVDYWFFRVHQQLLDTLQLSMLNQGERHAQPLKIELEKQQNNGLLDVASNSCLMSFVCSVAFSQFEGSPLPTQRICLYESIVNSMLTLWSSKRSTIPITDLIRILCDIATYIHQNSASGLIHEEKMKEICIQSIKDCINKSNLSTEEIKTIEEQGCEFVRIIRDDVGVLAARGESLYGFLHLTFQEYFTCLKLIHLHTVCDRIRNVARSLRQYANDPRFRVPIALALGKISLSWSHDDFDRFSIEFIREDDNEKYILPLGAFMLISCGSDLVHYPSNDVLFDALDRLMIAAGKHKWSIACPFLFDHIIDALQKLDYNMVSAWIENLLSRSPPYDIQTVSALCYLLEGKAHEFDNLKWLNQSSSSMLQSYTTFDNENNEFTIDRLLVKLTFSNHRLLPINAGTLKEFLITREVEMTSIPVVLFPLIVTLYGGLKRTGRVVTFDPFHIYRESMVLTPILIRVLRRSYMQIDDEVTVWIKEECLTLLLKRIQNNEQSSDVVDLCIAIICLQGTSNLEHHISRFLIELSMNRLKYISIILRQFYFSDDENDRLVESETTKMIDSVVKRVDYIGLDNGQFIDLINVLKRGLARLRSSDTSILLPGTSGADKRLSLHFPKSMQKEKQFLNDLLCGDIQLHSNQTSCSILYRFVRLFYILEYDDELQTQYRMAVAMDSIPAYLLLRHDEDLLFPLTFVPSHLQNLYLRLLENKFILINPNEISNNDHYCLHFGHILTECLILLSNASCKLLSIFSSLIALLSWFRMYQLENFASSFLWDIAIRDSNYLHSFEIFRQRPMNYETGQYLERVEMIPLVAKMKANEWKKLIQHTIEMEYQRFLNTPLGNDGRRDMELFSISITLAQVWRWNGNNKQPNLLNEGVKAAMSITNELIRLDALCMIALYNELIDGNTIEIGILKYVLGEIERLFTNIYPNLPLLLHAAIFIRCLPLIRDQDIIKKCLQNLRDKYKDADQCDQQAVSEALSPYSQLTMENISFPWKKKMHSSSLLMSGYWNTNADQDVSSSILLANIHLTETVHHFYNWIRERSELHTNVESIIASLFALGDFNLTLAQALKITNILLALSTNESEESQKLYTDLHNGLRRINFIEFKARHLMESWMKWKDSKELSSFAYQAAILLLNSEYWSVDGASIVCDLLCNESDYFRQQAEIILRSPDDYESRTSSKVGIDVLLTILNKKAHYQLMSPFGTITLYRMLDSVAIDIQSHLETLLWLERYRIHLLIDKNYSVNRLKSSRIADYLSFFPTDDTINILFCDNLSDLSDDLTKHLCEQIKCNFSTFIEINGDATSDLVLKSHVQFVVSILVSSIALMKYNDEIRPIAIDALTQLIDVSEHEEIGRAAAYGLGYACERNTYKTLYHKIQMEMEKINHEFANYSTSVLSSLITSYCHCGAIDGIDFDEDDMKLLRQLLKYPSIDVVKATQIGLARILKDSTVLLQMLDSDYIQCYHALIYSTAYVFLYDIQRISENVIVTFIEQHPDLLSIFIVELYDHIRHFTNNVQHVKTIDYYLAYAYPQYVAVAASIAVRIPAAFCAYIKDWCDGDHFKQALFYASKQHERLRRAGCLTILSIFGELTVELCEMLAEGLRDDPNIQSTCYKCLNRIVSISNEKKVLKLLLQYMKSKSMNARYVAAKILLRLSQSNLIPFEQVEKFLNDLILDPDSTGELWLIEEQKDVASECVYNYVGRLKDVIYSLLIQHLTGNTANTIYRHVMNKIDFDFSKSEEAARLSSCLYEEYTADTIEQDLPVKTKAID